MMLIIPLSAVANRALEVRLLGPLTVLQGGKPVELGGIKRREVVAFLAFHAGRVVPLVIATEGLHGAVT